MLGFCQFNIKFNHVQNKIKFYIIRRGGPVVLDRDFRGIFNIKFTQNSLLNNISGENYIILSGDFKEVFSSGLGTFNKGKDTLKLKHEVTKFFRPRQLPFGIKNKVETELDRLLELKSSLSIFLCGMHPLCHC